MKINYEKLQETEWNTIIHIEFKSEQTFILDISELVIDAIKYENCKLHFKNLTKEWAMFWNEKTKDWETHKNMNFPTGIRISAFNAKPVGEKILYSFGGNNPLGFSRWGFYADEVEFKES